MKLQAFQTLFQALLITAIAGAVGLPGPGGVTGAWAATRPEARDTLIALLTRQAPLTAEEVDYSVRLLLSYRSDAAPAAVSIADGPYPRIAVAQQIETLYPELYDSTYPRELEKTLTVYSDPEAIFDLFMEQIAEDRLDESLPREVRKAAGKIGGCLAKKALRGKSDRCELDKSPRVRRHGFLKQAWMKFDCVSGLGTVSACRTRRILFDEAKPSTVKAMDDPVVDLKGQVRKEFAARFPQEFRAEFVAQLGAKLKDLPGLIAGKFKGDQVPLWSASTPLAESDSGDPSRLSLRSFASGLRADIGMAALLARSSDPARRGMAAALFYAAANRLLMLTGGQELAWDGARGRFVVDDSVPYDPARPKLPPRFVMTPFGGWGLGKPASGPGAVFSPWDWAAYAPADGRAPTPFRIFPSEFLVGARGRPALVPDVQPRERLEDLAELLAGLTEFLRVTGSGTELSQYFGTPEQMKDLLEPGSPVIFPLEGRMLGLGVIAAISGNLGAPTGGHLEQTGTGTRLVFHEWVGLGGRARIPTSVVSVSRLLLSAADLLKLIRADHALPDGVLALEPTLVEALQGGVFALGAGAQGSDGAFHEQMNAPQALARQLRTQVVGLRALTRVYRTVGIQALLALIESSWKFLDRYWGTAELPVEVEGSDGPLSTSVAIELLATWDETQAQVRPVLAALPWSRWESRMESLRAEIRRRMGSR